MMVEGDAVVGSWHRDWPDCRSAFLDGVQLLPHPGMLHHSFLFRDRLFDESFRIAGDYEFLLRELKSRAPKYVHDVIVAGIARGGLSQEIGQRIASLKETRRARTIHGLNHWPWRWYRARGMTTLAGLAHRSLGARALSGGRKLRGVLLGRGRLLRVTTRVGQ